jgi:phosphoglycolate phosphatase
MAEPTLAVPDAPLALLVTDIDNTLFDWVAYYVAAFSALLTRTSEIIGVPYDTLAAESRDVFSAHGSIEYPFLVQELPSVIAHYDQDIDGMLAEAVRPSRDAFLEAGRPHLQPYADVPAALREIRARHPGVPVVALTDAPRYVAMWKLNKLGLLDCFEAVYGLADPRLPTSAKHGRVKVDPEILLKHLQQKNFGFTGKIRILPDDYEKPGTKGLKTVLMDYDLDENPAARRRVVWVGDNQRKDVGLGRALGVRTAWAAYGRPDPALLTRLGAFRPPLNVHKNAAIAAGDPAAPKADVELGRFGEMVGWLASIG